MKACSGKSMSQVARDSDIPLTLLSSGQRLGSLLMTRLMTLSWRFLLILALERARSIKLRGEIYGYEYHEDEE